MAKDKLTPGKTAPNKASKPDLKGIVGNKGKNLAGSPRSAGLNLPSKGKQGFSTVRKITGA